MIEYMAQSMNTKVDYSVAASSFLGLSSQGKVMVGDAAFEYYNDRNVEDYIQIPWEEVDYIQASVLFGKWINRFAIYTKKNGHFTFSAKDNKQLLREVRKYVPQEKMYRSLTFFQVITRGVKGIVRRILRK
jgi:hypothetical protein